MNNATIISALKTHLDAANGLSYIKQVLLGNRQIETITLYPTLIIEPMAEQESQEVYTVMHNKLIVNIMGLINVTNPDKQIVGDANTNGVMDVVNDLKTALDADYTLGGVASHMVIGETQYSSELYPVRMFALDVEIWFRQIKGTRT